MKTKFTFFLNAMAFILLTSCHNNAGVNTSNGENKTDSTANSTAKPTSNFDLLQGKWQSSDDKTNFLVFEKNHRKEIADGMKNWDDEEFTLSDKCGNETNKSDNLPKEKDTYISCLKSDLCWHIETLTADKLVLTYMGRGNTLIYNKVK